MPSSPNRPVTGTFRFSPGANTGSTTSTKTTRSSVSKAFEGSSNIRGPNTTSVGTITDSSLTAKELLTQRPRIGSPSQNSVASSATGKNPVVVTPGSQVQSSTSNTTLKGTSVPSITHKETASSPSSPSGIGIDEDPNDRITIGHGLIDVSPKFGAIVDLIISLLATIFFLATFLVLELSGCYKEWLWLRMIAVSSSFGCVMSLFLAFHACFERRFTPGRGLLGCMIFFLITACAIVNFVGAMRTTWCVCKCGSDMFDSNYKEDLYMFCLLLFGSFSLIAILFVSSVIHK